MCDHSGAGESGAGESAGESAGERTRTSIPEGTGT